MVRLFEHYHTYRDAGLSRGDALRLAWSFVRTGRAPVPLRASRRR